MRKNRFTLIELLVVVAIIAILLSLLLPSLLDSRKKAKRALELSTRKQLFDATMIYVNNNSGYYPDRGNSVSYLHQMKDGNRNINKSLFEEYVGEGQEIRTIIAFCESNLMDVRGPENAPYDYKATYCTLNYYIIPNGGNLHDANFNYNSIYQAIPKNALWACMSLRISTYWFGHNAPVEEILPEGCSTAFIDGSGRWIDQKAMELLWTKAGRDWFVPVR